MKKVILVILGIAVLFVSSATASTSGGVVRNATPSVLGTSLPPQQNLGYTATFAGTVFDGNGEKDIATVHAELKSATATLFSTDYSVKASDLTVAASKGVADATAPSLWVWNLADKDGKLDVAVEYTFNSAGLFTFGLSSTDDNGATTSLATKTIEIVDKISVSDVLIGLDGSEQEGAWGNWAYVPGTDTEIRGTNFVQITNSGVADGQTFTLDFTDESFYPLGTDLDALDTLGADELVPINGHIVFGFVELTPEEVSDLANHLADITWESEPSAEGSFNGAFTARGNTLFVTYKIVAPPSILVDQDYTAELTITPA